MEASLKMRGEAWYDKAIRFCIYSLAVAVPAVFSPWFYAVFSMPKLLALRLLTLAIIVLWGCKVFVERKISWRKSRLNVLLIIYGVISVLNTVYSIAPLTSLYGAETRYLGIFTILNFLLLPLFVFNFLTEKKTIKTFLIVSVTTAGVLAFYGFMQYQGFFEDLLQWNQSPADRVFGTVGHGNHFGAYLGMNILLAVFLFPLVKKGEQRWLVEIGLFLMTLALFLTASRGALFATVFALFICGLIVAVKNRETIRKFFRTWYARAGLVIVLAVLIVGVITGQLTKLPPVERTIGTVSFVQRGNIPDRLSWWLSTLEMVKDRPLLGFGLSAYRDIYNAYRRTDYKAPGPGDIQDLITPEAAHNEYLNMAATQGLIGLAAFLAIVVFIFWKIDDVTMYAKKIDDRFYLTVGVKGALMVYLVQALVSFGVITTWAFFFLAVGLAAALTRPEAASRHVSVRRGAQYIVAVVIIAAASAAAYFSVREAGAEIFYKQAQVYEAAGNLRGAIEEYQKTVLAKPDEYAYYQAFGDFALKNADAKGLNPEAQAKMLNLAAVNYENAAGINPHHPSVFYNLGLTRLQLFAMTRSQTHFTKASENLEKSVTLAVNNPIYPYQAGKAYLALGGPQAKPLAAAAFKKALNIRPGYRDAEALLRQTGYTAPGNF